MHQQLGGERAGPQELALGAYSSEPSRVPVGLGQGLAPLKVSAAPEVQLSRDCVAILQESESILRELRLSDSVRTALRNEFELILRGRDATAVQSNAVFQKLLLECPEVQALRRRIDTESAGTIHHEFLRSKVALIGTIYGLAKLVSYDPMLAAEVLRGYEAVKVDWCGVRKRLDIFYLELASDPKSPFRQLLKLHLSDSSELGESSFLAGLLAPYLGALQREPRTRMQRWYDGVRSTWSAVSKNLQELALGNRISIRAAEELEELFDTVQAARTRAQRETYDRALPQLRHLLLDSKELDGVSEGHEREIHRQLLAVVQQAERCSEDDLKLILDKVVDETYGAQKAAGALDLPLEVLGVWSEGDDLCTGMKAPLIMGLALTTFLKIESDTVVDETTFSEGVSSLLTLIDEDDRWGKFGGKKAIRKAASAAILACHARVIARLRETGESA